MNDLVQQISRDLVLYPFENESDEKFGNRIIYSALVSWIKVQLLTSSYTDLSEVNKEYSKVSKRYISGKINDIIEGFIETIPYLDTWIKQNEDELFKKNLIEYLIKKLQFCYQISETLESCWLTISPKQIISFTNNQLVLGGTDWNSNLSNCYSVGLGVWREKKNNFDSNFRDAFGIPKCNLKEYYESLESTAVWKKIKLDDEYEYFSGQTNLWHSKSWKKFNEKYIPIGVSLIRKKFEKNNCKLLLHKDNCFFTSKLDKQYYIDEKEINRIMYAIEYYRGNAEIGRAHV